MIRCDECLRANPPTRVACLYCSAPLPMTEESARLRKPVLKPPEKHQTAYNNILLPSEREVPDEDLAQGADLLKLSAENLKRIMAAKIHLPVEFIASRDEAELVLKRFRDVVYTNIT